MEFFDNAVIKAKEAIDFACKKTTEVVSTGKSKFDIATLENKLSKEYEKLGKIYFESIKDNEIEDSNTKELVDSIIEKNKQIKEIKQQINFNKNVRTCYKCGHTVLETDVFCSNCGEKLVFVSEE